MRVTIDTNVLVSALGWNGAEAAVIEMVLESKIELCISAQILSEFYKVVKYPRFGFTEQEIDGFIGRLLTGAALINPVQSINAVLADPDDNKIIECAVAGESSCIITGDRHLSQLVEYQGIEIMRAVDFLQKISRQ
ncbi:MAG: putative toxin-antitoxin system toxin component, PIN family [Actinobacteria bacterium]|nr:putative toxin-antitoxin system toxin component, PIN family [Actinomycetota bacterium]